MDPTATATEMVRLARTISAAIDSDRSPEEQDSGRLAALVLAFAEWRGRGGGFDASWAAALEGAL